MVLIQSSSSCPCGSVALVMGKNLECQKKSAGLLLCCVKSVPEMITLFTELVFFTILFTSCSLVWDIGRAVVQQTLSVTTEPGPEQVCLSFAPAFKPAEFHFLRPFPFIGIFTPCACKACLLLFYFRF